MKMTDVCATSNDACSLGITKFSDTYPDSPYFHSERVNHSSLLKVAKRPVPVQKSECQTPKKYAENGFRIPSLRQPYPRKTRGEYNLEVGAFQSKHPHQTRRKKVSVINQSVMRQSFRQVSIPQDQLPF